MESGELLVPMEVADRLTVVAAAAVDSNVPPLLEAELDNRRLHFEAAGTGNTGAAVGPFAAAAVEIAPVVVAARNAAGGEAVRGR